MQLACEQTSPLPQKKFFSEGVGTSVHRLSHHRPVNDLSTAVQLTNRLLHFWADEGFVYYKRVSSPSFLVSSQSLINNVMVCNRAG